MPAIPIILTPAEGAINTIAALLIIFGTSGDNPFDSPGGDLVPFPGGNSTPPGQCGPDDDDPEDPCERERRRLQQNRDILMNSLSDDPGLAARQLRGFARAFNPIVEMHNTACPGHRVEPITIGPVRPGP